MERDKATALPSPSSKAAKAYFANLCTLLDHTINLELPDPEFQVYIQRPASISSFNDSTLETLLDLLRLDEEDLEGYEHRYGGKLLTFTSRAAATALLKQFQSMWWWGKKLSAFTPPPPVTHSGVRVRVMGLPRPFSSEHLSLLGQSLALSPSHLVHSEVLRSRRGKATDKGLLIFSVCPFSLPISKSASIAGCDIQFQFMNRDAQCHLCDHVGHSPEYCYTTHDAGLRNIYFDGDGVPSFTPPTPKVEEKENEKEAAETPKPAIKDPPKDSPVVTKIQDSRPPPKGRGR